MKKESGNSIAFLSGVILGATTGAVVSLLLAPESGKNTRKKIYKKGKLALNEIKEKSEEVGRSLEPQVRNVKKEVKERLGELQEGFSEGKGKSAQK